MTTKKTRLYETIFKKCCSLLRNSRGFNIIELMIVVLIIGILAGVAIPLYLGYIQKSRVRMLVYPGLHIIETNISLYYAMHSELPDASRLPSLWEEANTDYFHADIIGDTLKITIYSPGDSRDLLTSMDGMPMYLEPVKDGSKISTWYLSGTLAKHLGIQSGAP